MPHTKGKWEVLQWGRDIQGHDSEAAHEVMTVINKIPISICQIPLEQFCSTSSPDEESDPSYHVTKDQSVANARLISYAPELLYVLHDIIETYGSAKEFDALPHLRKKALKTAMDILKKIYSNQ